MEKITDENVLEVFLRVAGQIWDGLELYEEEDLSDLKLLFNPNKPFKMYFCAVGKPPLITGVFTCFEQDPKRDIYALYCDNFWKILESH